MIKTNLYPTRMLMNSHAFEPYQFPWIENFYNAVLANGRPELTGPTLLITSDYSGNNKKSKFVTSSILILDMNKAGDWNKQRHNVRETFLPNGREMSFKKLNDAYRRRALIPFLDAANLVQGLCVTIAMLKELYSFTRNGLLLENVIERASFPKGKWKVEPFEEMFITVYFVSLLIAAFAIPNQNIYWVS